jgi:hypothetical protein
LSGTHSILSPSDSARWLRCVGALHLSKGLPDIDKEYNASGSCSHWLLEWQLKNPTLDLDVFLGKTMTFGENPSFTFTIDEERLERVRSCVTNVNREPGEMFIEERLDTTPVLGVPDQEGHADIVKLYPEGGVMKDGQLLRGVITIHDYKDGYLLVNAKDNTQGMIYLCAAMMLYSLVGEFEAFRFCVHQPKLHHYDEWTWSRAELVAFMQAIRPVAKLAYDIWHGVVEFDPAIHLNPGEEQCLWCPVRGRCVARAKHIISLFEPLIQKHELDDKTLSLMYARLDEVESACRDFRAEALRRALMNRTIDGQKLVKGKRGARKWLDKKGAEVALSFLLPEEEMYEPQEIISPTRAEKLLKGSYQTLADLVTQSEGSLSLAPLDDPRDAVVLPQFQPAPAGASMELI